MSLKRQYNYLQGVGVGLGDSAAPRMNRVPGGQWQSGGVPTRPRVHLRVDDSVLDAVGGGF